MQEDVPMFSEVVSFPFLMDFDTWTCPPWLLYSFKSLEIFALKHHGSVLIHQSCLSLSTHRMHSCKCIWKHGFSQNRHISFTLNTPSAFALSLFHWCFHCCMFAQGHWVKSVCRNAVTHHSKGVSSVFKFICACLLPNHANSCRDAWDSLAHPEHSSLLYFLLWSFVPPMQTTIVQNDIFSCMFTSHWGIPLCTLNFVWPLSL